MGLGVSTDCALQRLIIHYMFTVRTERVKSEGLMRAEFEVGAASSPLAMCKWAGRGGEENHFFKFFGLSTVVRVAMRRC